MSMSQGMMGRASECTAYIEGTFKMGDLWVVYSTGYTYLYY